MNRKQCVTIFTTTTLLINMIFISGCSKWGSKERAEYIMSVPTALWPDESKLMEIQEKGSKDENFIIKNSNSRMVVNQVLNKSIDIAVILFAAEDNEKLQSEQIGVMPYVFFANSQNGVNNLTTQQITDIFTGKIKNWREIGGNDLPIIVYNPNYSSEINIEFSKQFLSNGNWSEDCIFVDTEGELLPKVEKIPGAVSYIELTMFDYDNNYSSAVQVVKIDGFLPNEENVKQKKYPALLPINLLYRPAIKCQ